ncbi:hypothetical protein AFLA_006668 [Aspergillus flavus NRRL3357]|nr:hypothetical protein AFLA_006668 [Aspergillus flavus NRRL3357]
MDSLGNSVCDYLFAWNWMGLGPVSDRACWLKKLRPHRRPAPYGDMLLGQTPNQLHDSHADRACWLKRPPARWHNLTITGAGSRQTRLHPVTELAG